MLLRNEYIWGCDDNVVEDGSHSVRNTITFRDLEPSSQIVTKNHELFKLRITLNPTDPVLARNVFQSLEGIRSFLKVMKTVFIDCELYRTS